MFEALREVLKFEIGDNAHTFGCEIMSTPISRHEIFQVPEIAHDSVVLELFERLVELSKEPHKSRGGPEGTEDDGADHDWVHFAGEVGQVRWRGGV